MVSGARKQRLVLQDSARATSDSCNDHAGPGNVIRKVGSRRGAGSRAEDACL